MSQWKWKDTVDRLQYLDGIIDQIIRETLVIDGLILTFIPASVTFFHPENQIINHLILVIICGMAVMVNLLGALNLARQEYIRQWYFALLPPSVVPFMPTKTWFPYTFKQVLSNSIKSDSFQIQSTNYLNDIDIDVAKKRLLLCWIGKNQPGYCQTYFILFIGISILFICLGGFFLVINF